MTQIVFIADLHLSQDRPEVLEIFQIFLNNLKNQKVEQLYILGDLFEFWIGDDDPRPLCQTIAIQLTTLAQSGCQIFFMAGNRDFLIGESYAGRCSFDRIPDPSIIMLNNIPILLTHGDLLCHDPDYQRFRHLVRSQAWQQGLMQKTWQERIAIAKSLRMQSQQENHYKTSGQMDVDPDLLFSLLQEHQTSDIIHGHTHRPGYHQHLFEQKNIQRWVLGSWEQKTIDYLWYTDSTLQAMSFPDGNHQT